MASTKDPGPMSPEQLRLLKEAFAAGFDPDYFRKTFMQTWDYEHDRPIRFQFENSMGVRPIDPAKGMRVIDPADSAKYMHFDAVPVLETKAPPFSALLARFSYKPNTTFSVHGRELIINMAVQDRDTHEGTMITSRHLIPDDIMAVTNIQQAVNWVRNCLWSLEEHEMNEWLKFEEKRLLDPHTREELRFDS